MSAECWTSVLTVEDRTQPEQHAHRFVRVLVVGTDRQHALVRCAVDAHELLEVVEYGDA